MLAPVSRIPLAVAVIACLASVASTASAASPGRSAFRDSILSPGAARSTASIAEWGGPTVATDGETVTIYFSDSYPADPALATQWANFMTSLVHGPELQTVTIHLAPVNELQKICGSGALACYDPSNETIYAPGPDPAIDTSAKGVLIHEYGHHIAASRDNPPFSSEDYGTKRWASYENICSKARAGTLYPGAEDELHYMLNPGEAFAETYRVLNEQKLGLPPETWSIVTKSLYPDATALSLLEQDVTTPWQADTVKALTAKLTSKVRTKTFVVSTPLDGTISVKPRQSGKVRVSVSLLAKTKTVGTSTFSRAGGPAVTSTVCGVRSYSVRAKLTGTVTKRTQTTVSLSVTTP